MIFFITYILAPNYMNNKMFKLIFILLEKNMFIIN